MSTQRPTLSPGTTGTSGTSVSSANTAPVSTITYPSGDTLHVRNEPKHSASDTESKTSRLRALWNRVRGRPTQPTEFSDLPKLEQPQQQQRHDRGLFGNATVVYSSLR
jgi:hypothetical protein